MIVSVEILIASSVHYGGVVHPTPAGVSGQRYGGECLPLHAGQAGGSRGSGGLRDGRRLVKGCGGQCIVLGLSGVLQRNANSDRVGVIHILAVEHTADGVIRCHVQRFAVLQAAKGHAGDGGVLGAVICLGADGRVGDGQRGLTDAEVHGLGVIVVALAGDGHGSGTGVGIFAVRQGVVRGIVQRGAVHLNRGCRRMGGAGVGQARDGVHRRAADALGLDGEAGGGGLINCRSRFALHLHGVAACLSGGRAGAVSAAIAERAGIEHGIRARPGGLAGEDVGGQRLAIGAAILRHLHGAAVGGLVEYVDGDGSGFAGVLDLGVAVLILRLDGHIDIDRTGDTGGGQGITTQGSGSSPRCDGKGHIALRIIGHQCPQVKGVTALGHARRCCDHSGIFHCDDLHGAVGERPGRRVVLARGNAECQTVVTDILGRGAAGIVHGDSAHAGLGGGGNRCVLLAAGVGIACGEAGGVEVTVHRRGLLQLPGCAGFAAVVALAGDFQFLGFDVGRLVGIGGNIIVAHSQSASVHGDTTDSDLFFRTVVGWSSVQCDIRAGDVLGRDVHLDLRRLGQGVVACIRAGKGKRGDTNRLVIADVGI